MAAPFMKAPCETCPYRRSVRTEHWHAAEFIELLRHDAHAFAGRRFGCHSADKQPYEESHPCVGWLLDQRRREYPSLMLRLRMSHSKELGRYACELDEDGLDLYDSIHEMCRANDVDPDEHDPRMKYLTWDGHEYVCDHCGNTAERVDKVWHKSGCVNWTQLQAIERVW
jgi:hypothetical protein